MQHSFLTAAIPFETARVPEVEARLDEIGNPVKKPVRELLKNSGIHFLSISVLPGDFGHGAFLVFEATADQPNIAETLVNRLGSDLTSVGRAAGLVNKDGPSALETIKTLIQRHARAPGL